MVLSARSPFRQPIFRCIAGHGSRKQSPRCKRCHMLSFLMSNPMNNAFEPSSTNPAIAILGVPFDPVTMTEAIAIIGRMVASRRPHYVVTANVDFLAQARGDIELRRILMDAHLVLCDGTPVVWA